MLVNALGDSIRKPLVTLPGNAGSAAGVSDDELRFIMDINLTEALLCTRAVGPHMLARRSGKVINIASWTAHQGGRDMVIYTTAKTALAGFTRAQALEWAPYGVHVNAIAPGIFPDVVTSGEERVRQSDAARRADRAAAAPGAAAGGRIAGALPGVECVGLHDRADHTARRRAGIVTCAKRAREACHVWPVAKRIEQLAPELEKIISTSEPIQDLADGFGGPHGPAEGPLWWKEGGYLLFSDIHNNRRMKYVPG